MQRARPQGYEGIGIGLIYKIGRQKVEGLQQARGKDGHSAQRTRPLHWKHDFWFY